MTCLRNGAAGTAAPLASVSDQGPGHGSWSYPPATTQPQCVQGHHRYRSMTEEELQQAQVLRGGSKPHSAWSVITATLSALRTMAAAG